MLGVFRNRHFMQVWSGQIISNVGDWFTYVALIIRIYSMGYGAVAVSGLLMCQMGSSLLVGLFAGVLADRFDRRRLMVVVDIARAALVFAAVFTHNLLLIYALVFFCGAGAALFQPALSASIPNIVRRDQLGPANSLITTTYNLGFVAGPAIGGIIVGIWGVAPALVGDAASFLLSALLIGLARVPQEAREVGRLDLRATWTEMVEGVGYIRRQVEIKAAVVGLLAVMGFAGMINVVEIYFAKDVLHAGDQGFGYMISGWGIGMVLGSLILGLVKTSWRPVTVFLTAVLLQGFGVGMVGLTHHLYTALVFLFIGGFGNGAQGVAALILIQQEAPDQIRGRVLATRRTMAYTGWVLSMAVGGLLAEVMSLRLIYIVCGLGHAAVVLYALWLLRGAVARRPKPAAAA